MFFWIILLIISIYLLLPYFLVVKIQKIPESHIIYDMHDIEIWELIADKKYRHRYKEWDYFPEFLIQSIIAIEDQRFYHHAWVDYKALGRAFINNIQWKPTQGASTIHSQVIRNNYWLNKKRTYTGKIQEFFLARSLDIIYDKDAILTAYLNNINFWYLNYWFESAAIYYYWKSVEHLTKAEIIWLITIIKNPNRYNPLDNPQRFRKRFEILSHYLYEKWLLSSQEKNLILDQKILFSRNTETYLPYIIDFIARNKHTKPSQIHTTIDYYMTQEIQKIWEATMHMYAWKNVRDYAVIVIDRHTHELNVMIGWYDYFGEDGQVNATLALRQPGSTLKPFIYLLAFSELWMTPWDTIWDLPVNYITAEWNIYSPKNYTLDFKWEITLAQALSQSINVPAVKLLEKVWVSNFINLLHLVWISSIDKDEDHYWLSIWLWSAEKSLYELTRSYSLFAHNGSYCDITYIQDTSVSCQKIFDETYAQMVFDILSDRYFKLEWFPINSNLDFPDREVFVKTWTSRNFKDNWTIWYTNNHIIWVWVGNKDASEMLWVSWVTWAGHIFNKIVYLLDDTAFSREPRQLDIRSQERVYITSPLHNSIYTYDASIPESHQKIRLDVYTNLDYDEVLWKKNWELLSHDIIHIKDLININNIEVILKKNNHIIWSDVSIVKLQEF